MGTILDKTNIRYRAFSVLLQTLKTSWLRYLQIFSCFKKAPSEYIHFHVDTARNRPFAEIFMTVEEFWHFSVNEF